MANDKNHAKNPTAQLRSRVPSTHSERHFAPTGDDTSGNPWDALQTQGAHARKRPAHHWMSLFIGLGIGALAIILILLLT